VGGSISLPPERGSKMWSGLKQDILTKRRKFFIDMVQAPLMWKITKLGSKYPIPTHADVNKPNSHIYIDLFDEFETYNTARQPLIAAFKRVFIGKYEADDWYAERINWFLFRLHKLILMGKYEAPWVDCPTTHWDNPEDIEKVALARIELMMNLGKEKEHVERITQVN